MYKLQEYKGYTYEIGSVDKNSPYDSNPDVDKFWYKSIIIPPKDKKERCLNIEFHDISFIAKYVDDNLFPTSKNVECDIINALKEKGYITLELKDKELRRRDYILEDVSRQLIDHIESVLDLKEDSMTNNNSNGDLIERDKIGNLESYETINENLTPRPEFHKLILRHVVNSENSTNEIDQIIEMLNDIKSYIE